MAFFLQNTFDQRPRMDPRYVKLALQTTEIVFTENTDIDEEKQTGEIQRETQVLNIIDIPYHTCTEEDFAKFYEMDENTHDQFQNLRMHDHEEYGGFKCVDWDKENIELYNYVYNNYKAKSLSLFLLPCNMRSISRNPIYSDDIHEECIADHQKQKDYLGDVLALQILFNS